jgi:hypothetical protein
LEEAQATDNDGKAPPKDDDDNDNRLVQLARSSSPTSPPTAQASSQLRDGGHERLGDP